MKKLALLLTIILTFALSCVCFAADGSDLNKEQRAAEKIVTALNGDAATEYTAIASGLTPELDQKLGVKGYTAIQKQVKEQLGSLKSNTFYRFERFDNLDRVTYVAEFSKEKVVALVFEFNKNAKMINFSFIPQKQAEATDKK